MRSNDKPLILIAGETLGLGGAEKVLHITGGRCPVLFCIT